MSLHVMNHDTFSSIFSYVNSEEQRKIRLILILVNNFSPESV